MTPGIVAVPLELENELPITLPVTLIALSTGTLNLHVAIGIIAFAKPPNITVILQHNGFS